MRIVLPAAIATLLIGGGDAYAQTVLDRVDPAEVEPKERPVAREKPAPAVVIDAPARTAPVSGGRTYSVGAIAVTGLRALQPAMFVDIVQDYGGRTLGARELEALADRIARRARERGYPFATASIAPQRIDAGALFVTVDEGAVDRVELSGVDTPAMRAALAPLADGGAVSLAQLERRLLLLGDIGGVRVRRTRYERRGDAGILIVETLRDRVSGRVRFENDGSRPIGPEQAHIDIDINGLLASDDSLSLAYSTTPFEPEELQAARARYSRLIDADGTEVGIGGAISSTYPGAYLADRDIFGRSWRIELDVRRPLLRRRAASLWIEGAFELRDLRQERDDLLARHDRVAVLRAGVYGLADLYGGRLRGRATVSQGLDAFGATRRGDPLASRGDAVPDFTVLSGWFDWTASVAPGVSVKLAGLGQLSTEPLLISEDLGLGGTRFLRGYNYNERSGDQGAIGSGELRYDWARPAGLVRRAQLYAFADGGVVDNLRGGRGSGSLASAGGGVRTAVTRALDIDLQLAFPLTGPRYDTDDMTPRFNFRVGQSF